jgi:uncharacterized membrane protein
MPTVLALALVLGCAGKDADSADAGCERTPPLTYDNFGKGFVGKHCGGCHSSLVSGEQRKGAPPGVDLDTYRGVVTWAYRVQARATADPPTMPPGGGPSGEELDRLTEWLECQVLRDADALAAEQGSGG